MKQKLNFRIILLLLIFLPLSAFAKDIKIDFSQGIFTIENKFACRQFKYESKSGIYYFYPQAWRLKNGQRNYLAAAQKMWFTFIVNDREIRSQDGGWKFENYHVRQLQNGGKEVTITLQGQQKRSAIHGMMKLIYRCQVFSDSPIFREQLEIISQKNKTIFLSKKDGRCRFIFPEYQWKNFDRDSLQVREIQLANWEGEVLDSLNWKLRPNYRLRLGGGSSGRNLSQNHMYHPRRIDFAPNSFSELKILKGPIALLWDAKNNRQIIFSYEHGSMDNDPAQQYLGISTEFGKDSTVSIKLEALKGVYYSHQSITKSSPFKSVWCEVGFFQGNDFQRGEKEIFNFIYHDLSEHLASRKATIYYNTWGMQRDEQKEKKIKPQLVLTEKRVLKEIDYAHELGADVFVIDDGWQNYFGDWQPVKDRFPDGFQKIKARLDSLGMRLGLWFAIAGVDSHSQVYAEHPEWLGRNADGSEVIGRWRKPVGCFASEFKNYLIEMFKHWIDQGVTYFKWDGLDALSCYSPAHWHGDENVPDQDRADNSAFRLILEVTDIARQITEYNPQVIIVLDVTEKNRPVGLAFLSEAKFFWINNGATWYDDLSYYRAKSIRSVANIFNQIIPTVLQTSANYPHQSPLYGAQMYNVHTTFLGGNGFWGDLSEMRPQQRKEVGELVNTYKKVANTTVSVQPRVTGEIGSSPEIYEIIDTEKAEGMVIGFSGSAMKITYRTRPVNRENFLAVLRQAYSLNENGSLQLPLLFPQADAVCSAFILSQKHSGFCIESSTCWLKDVNIPGDKKLIYVNGAPGRQEIVWRDKKINPLVKTANGKTIEFKIVAQGKSKKLVVATPEAGTKVVVYFE
ncbi:MAG: hypothetical protein GXO74_16475 [Calditrichaeota bacterium]|nr:hypothetical protein [Calditrichota bacterium]